MARRKRICFVIGTRPEAIKTWPVIEYFLRDDSFEVQTLLTGQHRELLHQMVELLKIPVTADLAVMREGQSLDALTSILCSTISVGLDQLKPDCVVVQGDTTTVFVAALAAFYLNVPVAHLEAGLRSHDLRHPFPEEMNRKLATVLSALHFAPTDRARNCLLEESVPADRIWVTGNSGIDALRLMTERLDRFPVDPVLGSVLDAKPKRLIAVTVHRRENYPFVAGIAHAIAQILKTHKDVEVVLPVHLSPAVRDTVRPILRGADRCHLLEPLDYANFVRLLGACDLVLTDSGGVQEEAPHLGKPTLVVRRTTERPEAVDAGCVRLVGEESDRIIAGVNELLTDEAVYRQMAQSINPYGDGHTSERVADVLREHVGERSAD